ncbi:ricin-type beta-trefoil lectin domain protein [Phytohabitans sp. ZYX-F-186]|uniref:Ricin-type beta-trefoil lectin domain protein n=1 Tax=Phytohabitans maris TaxID=3071409 RepID=A0ABU0ZG81_9ACTN|nr:ricin-type beta-trefoil lectin domain protein [Phytohabitans sp. ZYX-F-186]MDQ7906074.1 ricin-type beta-trefoil lectin domain protein [Phytohabitans sp. ZYX-F-186]
MVRRTRVLVFAAALALAAASPPAVAAAAPAPDPAAPAAAAQPAGLPAGQVAALRRDLGLTDAQIHDRLVVEAVAPFVERRLRADLGATYGGAWVAPDGGALVVGVTDGAQAARVRAAGARPRLVARSAAELDRAKAALDRGTATAAKSVHSWYVDPASNSVVVEASTVAAAERFARAAGVTGAVRTVATASPYRPVYDVRGGDEYVIDNRVLCSVGFAVSGGFVTAGHCGGVGSTTSGSGAAQGTFRGSSFPNNDYAWVQVNSNWVSRPVVNTYNGGTTNVAGSQEAAVGSSVCRSGRTTGWRCGTITAKNVTVNYSGSLVYGLVSSSACAQPGDSGGSFISGNQAQGVTSGAGGNCSTGGTTVYQPVNEILGAYGLSLTTTGGGGSTSRLIGYVGKCIDVPSSNGVDGQFLQLWTCNGTAAQSWTFPGDGTIRAFGLCMDVAWGSTANGATVQLANCSGNPAQQWVLSAAGDLVNPQANKCVDVSGWNTADGARLVTWECHGGANQKWYRG